MKSDSRIGGFTIIELLVVIAVIGVLVGLMLPAVRSSNEAARRMSCSNNIKQVGLALHSYHSAYKQLPRQMGGTFQQGLHAGRLSDDSSNQYRLSYLVALLPFLEQRQLWDTVSSGGEFPAMGPAPWTWSFEPWRTSIPMLRCPSDPGIGLPAHGRTNLAVCMGDAIDRMQTGATRWSSEELRWVTDQQHRIAVSGRGMFVPRQVSRFRDVSDGLSNTLMAGEITTDLDDRDVRTSASMANPLQAVFDSPVHCRGQIDPDRPLYWTTAGTAAPENLGDYDRKRGFRWADGATLFSGFNTILSPNRESCLTGGHTGMGMLTVSSRHQGGAHVLMGDGATVFLTDSIDCGDSKSATVYLKGTGARAPRSASPYGLWGALGTRATGEAIDEQLNR